MRLNCLEVVEVGLPVLYRPRVVAAQEPVLVVAPARRPDRAVVRLRVKGVKGRVCASSKETKVQKLKSTGYFFFNSIIKL